MMRCGSSLEVSSREVWEDAIRLRADFHENNIDEGHFLSCCLVVRENGFAGLVQST